MKDRTFDDIMRQSLSNLEVPYDASSWDALRQKMDASIPDGSLESATAVDAAVLSQLEQLEVPYQPGHWNILSQTLDARERRRKIAWYKMAEAAALLLLLFSFDNWWAAQSSERPIQRLHPQQQIIADMESSDNTGTYLGDNAIPSTAPALIPFEAGNTVNFAALEDQQLPFAQLIATDITENAVPAFAFQGLPETGALPGVPVRYLVYSESHASRTAVITKAPRTNHFYAITYGEAAQNTVRIAGSNRSSWGAGAGFGLGWKRGKWGVETGLGYASKQFEPKKEIEIYGGNVIDGYYGSALTGVEAAMVQIPLKITRDVLNMGKTKVSAVAGVSAFVATSKSYRYKKVYYPGAAPSGQSQVGTQEPTMQKTANGIAEGGSLSGNAYLTANAGMRIEHPISRRFAAFIEPSYQHQLTKGGIGPKPVGLNSLAISAGVITML
ncbi:MAG: hypothetical protein IPL65_00115 [Lewinellaceae bacterium]|nr:hypothetical protein [Lewinellaceae bacterium]